MFYNSCTRMATVGVKGFIITLSTEVGVTADTSVDHQVSVGLALIIAEKIT